MGDRLSDAISRFAKRRRVWPGMLVPTFGGHIRWVVRGNPTALRLWRACHRIDTRSRLASQEAASGHGVRTGLLHTPSRWVHWAVATLQKSGFEVPFRLDYRIGADGTFELGASALQAAARLAFRPAISALADSHFAFWAALLASQADLLCIYAKFWCDLPMSHVSFPLR